MRLIEAEHTKDWRVALAPFARVDVCMMPEYHLAYAGRISGAKPVMWCFEHSGHHFIYPFLLTPVVLTDKGEQAHKTPYQDISSIYGYGGPLSTTEDAGFLARVWAAFDEWAAAQNIIAEFSRYSLYAQTQHYAHPRTEILPNRPSAVTHLPESTDELLGALNKKTRNMIRKAEKARLIAGKLDVAAHIHEFRALYEATMERNEAADFFVYDDTYYDLLMRLPENELRLFGVYEGDQMVAAVISLSHGEGALYHLGASLQEYANLGASNLALFEMSCDLLKSGVKFITIGGGRTTADDDPLYKFKQRNATHTDTFCIGKRIVDIRDYDDVKARWAELNGCAVDTDNLIFYR